MRYLFLVLLVVLFMAVGCTGAEVRFDGAPSPVDLNQHTVLLEADCGDGVTRAGFGQVGCSWGAEAMRSGRLTIHTPLPGSIALYSRACGIDKADFHGEQGGSFDYELAELVPAGVTFCIIDVFVRWELPPKLKSDYPLRGMTGRVYLRQRHAGQGAAGMSWAGETTATPGIAWRQFREARDGLTSEPLALELRSPRPLKGLYRMYGCGQGVEQAPMDGEVAKVSRDALLGPAPKKGRCAMFGWLSGKDATGADQVLDAVTAVEVFGTTAIRLAVTPRIEGSRVCYNAEGAVSLAVLVAGDYLAGSNKVSDCLDLPEDGRRARLGFFTHQGRAAYAIVEAGKIIEVLQ